MPDLQHVVDMILDGDDTSARQALLLENEEEEIVRAMGNEVTFLNYLIKFEEYLDEHDIYLFDGWDDAAVIKPPKVEKFWVSFYLLLPKGADLRGAMRIKSNKEAQNEVKIRKLDDGSVVVKFKILKRYLDAIEARNKERAEQLAQDEAEKA